MIWKISCRAEYVEQDLFSKLRDAGLFLVYMGIESGVDAGLEVLHKQMTVGEQNLAGRPNPEAAQYSILRIWFYAVRPVELV